MMENKFFTLNIWYRLPFLALCGLIFWQSHFPSVMGPSTIPFADKIMHFGTYAVLAFLCVRWMQMEFSGTKPITTLMAGIFLTSLFGLSDEIHQSFIIDRTASVYDFMADCAGAVLGAWVFGFFGKIIKVI